MSETYALDIETSGLDRFTDRILCIGLYSPTDSIVFDTVDEFRTWLSAKPEARFVTHGGTFDVQFLRHHGIDIVPRWSFDTRSIASILIPGPGLAEGQKRELGLENLSIQLLGKTAYKLDRTIMTSYSQEEVRAYCLEDCQNTYELLEELSVRIPDRNWKFVETWLMPATKFCADLEWNGVHIDEAGLKVYQIETEKKRDQILTELTEMAQQAIKFYHEQQVIEVRKTYGEMYAKAKTKAKDQTKCLTRYQKLEDEAILRLEPFNWNSSTQLKWLLKEYYQLDIRNDREDKETTNEQMLRTLDHPVAKKLCDYREVEKLCSTCIPALLENAEGGFVHANHTVGGTRTGRLSSSSPNLHQIPRGPIRSYISSTSPAKVLLTVDYSQIEVRIIAELAKEKELVNAFKEGIDPYSVIAQKLLKIDCDVREIKTKFKKERDVSKTAGLSILYGTGAAKLQEVLNKELNRSDSLQDCRRFIEDYRASLPGVQALRKRLDRELANGKVSYNLLGRPFQIASNEDLYMKSLNTLVQGSASDLVVFSQTNFVIPALKNLGVDFTHRMIIHDEVVIELQADEAELLTSEVIIPAMTTAVQAELNLSVPMDVEFTIGRCWEKP